MLESLYECKVRSPRLPLCHLPLPKHRLVFSQIYQSATFRTSHVTDIATWYSINILIIAVTSRQKKKLIKIQNIIYSGSPRIHIASNVNSNRSDFTLCNICFYLGKNSNSSWFSTEKPLGKMYVLQIKTSTLELNRSFDNFIDIIPYHNTIIAFSITQ